MSFSRGKIARFIETKDSSHKTSAPSATMKYAAKPRTDKWAPPASLRNVPSTKTARARSLSQPPSAIEIGSKMPRPCSVGGRKINNQLGAEQSKADLDKTDDEIEFKSATVLQFPEQLTNIDERNYETPLKHRPSEDFKQIANKPSETKNNTSAIPLRIKASQASNKEIGKVGKLQSNRKFTTTSRSSNASRPTSPKRGTEITDNSLLSQFETRKKRFQALQEELSTKKHLISDSHNILVQLKKKLEESGATNVELDELKSDNEAEAVEPKLIENMTSVVNQIPSTLIDLCKNLMQKRLALLNTLDNFSKNKVPHDELEKWLKIYKDDTAVLEKLIDDHAMEQQQHTKNLVKKWAFLVSSSGDASNISDQIEELQGKLRLEEQQVDTVKNELQLAVQQCELFQRKTSQGELIIAQLKDKIKNMEHELQTEKNSVLSHKEKSSTYDQKLKTMKTRVQEMENKCKESENKYNELQRTCKHAQEQIKSNEHRWIKEKEELMSKNKHDKQMLDKLTKDRSCFETRVKSLEEYIEEGDKTQKTAEDKLKEDLEEARNLAMEEKIKRETLQEKYDHIQSQLVQMEIRNRQTVDIVNTKHTFEPKEVESISTDREAELYTELLATRVGLKAAEEKLQNYQREKLRFLDTLQSLQGDHKESVAPLQKDLKILELENSLNEKDEIICKQNIKISGLIVEVENLTLKTNTAILQNDVSYYGKDESDLMNILHEGKIKLEQQIKKSAETEQKSITYKYDLDKRNKQLYEMENLLKARDGLVTLIKAKKDDLQLENDSLNKYANKIRELLIESREEARTRNELVQELTMNLDSKARACEQQEKLIKELQFSLSLTSEKRFKLQDAIGAMEKELQHTKAHVLKMTSGSKIRYGIKVNPSYFASSSNRSAVTYSNTQSAPGNVKLYSHYGPSVVGRKSSNFMHKPRCPLSDNKPNTIKSRPGSHNCPTATNSVESQSNDRLDNNAVKSWLSYYQNIEDIQKRLKFLKDSFTSLSKKMILQDMKLKQTSVESKFSEKIAKRLNKASSSYKDELNDNPVNIPPMFKLRRSNTQSPELAYESESVSELSDKRSSLVYTDHPITSPADISTGFPAYSPSTQNTLTLQSWSESCNNKRREDSSKHYLNEELGKLITEKQVSAYSFRQVSRPPSRAVSSSSHTSSLIPVKKVRYSPLTLPSRVPTDDFRLLPIVVPEPHQKRGKQTVSDRQSNIPIPRNVNILNNKCSYNPYRSFLVNQSNNADLIPRRSLHIVNGEVANQGSDTSSRSNILYTNSNISTYANTKKQLQQLKSSALMQRHSHVVRQQNTERIKTSVTNNRNVINSPKITEIKSQPNYYQFESSTTGSAESKISIATVIKCSDLLNNLSNNENCNDLFKSEYVLKLFSQNNDDNTSVSNFEQVGDYSIRGQVKYLGADSTSANVTQSLTRSQNSETDSECHFE